MRLAMTLPMTPGSESPVFPLTVTLAIGLHVALALLAPDSSHTAARVLPSMEVDLTPPPPRDVTEPPPPEPVKAEQKALPPSARPIVQRAPAPAAAGKLLTADPAAAQASDAPLDFVTDPNGGKYGFGVVARGGSKEPGPGVSAPIPAASGPAAPVASRGDGLVAAADLSEKPRLVNDDPCAGFYPAEAVADSAFAVVRVIVEGSGRTRTVQLLEESPASQGFGVAARRCLAGQRWSPAKDHDGRAVPTATTFRVRFHR